MAWSGLRTYDLDRPRQRMSLYRTVLAEGQYEDLVAFLDRDLLTAQWPALRTLVSRHVRQAWEERFPQLAAGASSAA
ncbi:transcriptional regulator [Streptomyces lavendulae]|uniref:transcriptional regulator n=1 Tax=Streptomyces lavendulae TaxID=1914 RepID=UPI0036E56E80